MNEIEKNLYRLNLPLPDSPIKQIICYLIRGKERSLLIDTAFNHDDCERALMSQLDELGVKIEDTDIFITHKHIDHCGLIGRLSRPQNKIYASVADKVLIDDYQTPYHFKRITTYLSLLGIPAQYKLHADKHVSLLMKSCRLVDITALSEGDELNVGDFRLQVIEIPGHSPGHLALWEPDKRYLFSGDHILGDISPNITAWDLETDYLKQYIDSLKKVRAMPVRKLFPAHRAAPDDINVRIDELINLHRGRSATIMQILQDTSKPMSAFDVAILMEWSTRLPILENPPQLWFAAMETLSHLQHLRFEGRVKCTEQDEALYFSL